MKKFALASGLLFLVVYFWVNTITGDDSSFETAYPPMAVSTMVPAEMSSDDTPVTDPPSQDNKAVQGSGAYIIVASFADREQAKMMAEAYTEKYQAEIIVLPPTSGGHYRISYGSYSSTGEAKAALETIRQNAFPDAWILPSR